MYMGGGANSMFFTVAGWLSQLIVVMFFFYSGYGMMEQLKRRGSEYLHSFLSKRFLPTYVNFAICVFLYWIMNVVLKIQYPNKQILLSFTGWYGIGNSNWFMFVTFLFYFIFVLSFRFAKKLDMGFLIFCSFTFIFFIILHETRDYWWWNTLFCLPAGSFWSLYRNKIEQVLFSTTVKWAVVFCIILFFFSFFYFYSKKIAIVYVVTSFLFAFLIVIITMKVAFRKSYFFSFLGTHVFSIYILQRIPFIIFERIGLNTVWYFYLPICFVVTLLISILYDKLFEIGKIMVINLNKKIKVSKAGEERE